MARASVPQGSLPLIQGLSSNHDAMTTRRHAHFMRPPLSRPAAAAAMFLFAAVSLQCPSPDLPDLRRRGKNVLAARAKETPAELRSLFVASQLASAPKRNATLAQAACTESATIVPADGRLVGNRQDCRCRIETAIPRRGAPCERGGGTFCTKYSVRQWRF